MKLVITIDLPDEQMGWSVLDCVHQFAETVHAGFGVYGSRLLSDAVYAQYRERLHGPKPSGHEWVRWFARASMAEDP